MTSAIYILDENLNLLISRQYKHDLDSRVIISNFRKALRLNSNSSTKILSPSIVNCPFINYQGINYIYYFFDEIIILAVSFEDINTMCLMSFLSKFCYLLKEYFITFQAFEFNSNPNPKKRNNNININNNSNNNNNRIKNEATGSDSRISSINKDNQDNYTINSDIIKDNYILIYELFDEVFDYGIPQITDFNILKEYIKLKHHYFHKHKNKKSLTNSNNDKSNNNNDEDSSDFDSDYYYSDNDEFDYDSDSENDTKKFSNSNNNKDGSNSSESNDFYDGLNGTSTKKKKKWPFLSSSSSSSNGTKHSNQQQVDTTTNELINSSVSRTTTNKISWRPKGIFYNKNEIFLNFIETVHFEYNLQDHKIMVNSINGDVDCRSFLSGMPELKLGLNETLISNDFVDDDSKNNTESNSNNTNNNNKSKLIFDSINFNQCVELTKIATNNSITFIPPDGSFKLFSYQIITKSTKHLKPLILVDPIYKIFKSTKFSKSGLKRTKYKLQISTSIQTFFKKRFNLNDVYIIIPLIINQSSVLNSLKDENGNPFPKHFQAANLPSYAKLLIDFNIAPKFKTKLGSVSLNLETSSIIWKIPSLEGNIGEVSYSSLFSNKKHGNTPSSSSSSSSPSTTANTQNYYSMICEFELMSEDQFLKTSNYNQYWGKQDKNDLYYLDLKEEFSKIHGDDEKTSDGLALVKPLGNSIKLKKKLLYLKYDNFIRINFQLNSTSYSGLKVEFLTINEPQLKFQSMPWIRYLVKCGSGIGSGNSIGNTQERKKTHIRGGNDGEYLFRLGPDSFKNELTINDFEPIEFDNEIHRKISTSSSKTKKDVKTEKIDHEEESLEKVIKDHSRDTKVHSSKIKDFEEYIVEENIPKMDVDEEKVHEDEKKLHQDEEQRVQDSGEETEEDDDTVIHHDPEEVAITEETNTNTETEILPIEELQIEDKDEHEPITAVSNDINYDDDDDEFKAIGEEDIKWEVS